MLNHALQPEESDTDVLFTPHRDGVSTRGTLSQPARTDKGNAGDMTLKNSTANHTMSDDGGLAAVDLASLRERPAPKVGPTQVFVRFLFDKFKVRSDPSGELLLVGRPIEFHTPFWLLVA
jgi:hypothetical protein